MSGHRAKKPVRANIACAMFGAMLAALFCAPAVAQPAQIVPEWPRAFNWSESPVLLDLHQYGGVNDNILNSPPGVAPQASSFSRSAAGAATRLRLGQQVLTAEARAVATIYLQDRAASLHDRAWRLNWDQRAGAACKGRLIAEASDSQSNFEQAWGPGQDTLRARRLDEEARCAVFGPFGALLGAGAASRTHDSASASALDATSVHGKLGFDYEGRNRDHAALFVKLTGLRFPNAAPPLSAQSSQTDVRASYQRAFSPLWEARIAVGVSAAPPPTGPGRREIAAYDAELAWTPSDQWRATLAASRTLSAPISIQANSQIAQAQNLALTWRPTPKLSLTAALGRLWLEDGPANPGLYGGSTLLTGAARAVYQMTPFTSLTASFLRAQRRLASGETQTTIAMIGVDFKPYWP